MALITSNLAAQDEPHRIEFSLFHPLSMFKELVGPTIYSNCARMLCMLCVSLVCLAMLPLSR